MGLLFFIMRKVFLVHKNSASQGTITLFHDGENLSVS
jgi:hypothetical protein